MGDGDSPRFSLRDLAQAASANQEDMDRRPRPSMVDALVDSGRITPGPRVERVANLKPEVAQSEMTVREFVAKMRELGVEHVRLGPEAGGPLLVEFDDDDGGAGDEDAWDESAEKLDAGERETGVFMPGGEERYVAGRTYELKTPEMLEPDRLVESFADQAREHLEKASEMVAAMEDDVEDIDHNGAVHWALQPLADVIYGTPWTSVSALVKATVRNLERVTGERDLARGSHDLVVKQRDEAVEGREHALEAEREAVAERDELRRRVGEAGQTLTRVSMTEALDDAADVVRNGWRPESAREIAWQLSQAIRIPGVMTLDPEPTAGLVLQALDSFERSAGGVPDAATQRNLEMVRYALRGIAAHH